MAITFAPVVMPKGRRTPVSNLTISEPVKKLAKEYGESRFGSLTAYVEHLLKEDLERLGFDLTTDSLENIARRAGVKLRKDEKPKQ